MTMICLYCQNEKTSSISHIIPEALCHEKNVVLDNSVCKECNEHVNNTVEMPMINGLALFRSILGITGKRGNLPTIKMDIEFLGLRTSIYVYKPEDLPSKPLVFKSNDTNNSKKIYFFGPKEEVKKHQHNYTNSHPETLWGELPSETMTDIKYEISFDYRIFATEEALRMASKIAFEWWCKLKGDVNLLNGQEYDDIRRYILEGNKPVYPIACLVSHPSILAGLGNLPFGMHYIVISTNFNSPEVVAIVDLFGLIAYKIVLTKKQSFLTQRLSLVSIHPQTGNVHEHKLRQQLGDPVLYGHTEYDYEDPMAVIKSLSKEITEKINSSGFIQESEG